VDGGPGRDAVLLAGEAAQWRISGASDAKGEAKLAQHDAHGAYLLRDVEEVRFAEGGDQSEVDPPELPTTEPAGPVPTAVGSLGMSALAGKDLVFA
jgi:hypothetical protein